MADLKFVGADKPQQGQPLSPREEAVRRLKAKGFLDPSGQPMPRREFFVSLALAWATFAAALGGGLTALFAFMVPRIDFTRVDVSKSGRRPILRPTRLTNRSRRPIACGW